MRPYGILRRVWRQFLTDVSVQPVDPKFKGQEIQGEIIKKESNKNIKFV